MGWHAAAELIIHSLEKTVQNKTVMYDLSRQMEGATTLSCSAFANAIIKNMNKKMKS